MLLATGEVLGSVMSTSRGHAGSIRDRIDRQSNAQAIPWDETFGCMCHRLTTSLLAKKRRSKTDKIFMCPLASSRALLQWLTGCQDQEDYS